MLKNLFLWTKNNKIATILILILAYLVLTSGISRPVTPLRFMGSAFNVSSEQNLDFAESAPAMGARVKSVGYSMAPMANDGGINIATMDRRVVTNSNFSLQVKNVTETVNTVSNKVAEMGGFVINMNLTRPEFGEDAHVDVRIPNTKLDEFSNFLRGQAVKVVSEYVSGNDVTDQYVDIEERLTQLTKEKEMLDAILKKAITVEDIMKVRPYIQQVQNEIDNYKGQLKYMDGTTSTTLVTIFLATDELGLPYAPENTWRPEAIFKTAVRSLIGTMQGIGSGLIWLGVYSVLIVPAILVLLIALIVKSKIRRK